LFKNFAGERQEREMRNKGFTVIELMIVVAIIAIIAAIMVPYLLEARLDANEIAATATLRIIATAQEKFETVARPGPESDQGYYGTFQQLTGTADYIAAGKSKRLDPPLLTVSGFSDPEGGLVRRSGYYFRIDLIGEGESYRCYAWPVRYGASGRHTFMVVPSGDVYALESEDFSGEENPPAMDAAYMKVPETREISIKRDWMLVE